MAPADSLHTCIHTSRNEYYSLIIIILIISAKDHTLPQTVDVSLPRAGLGANIHTETNRNIIKI